MKWWPQKEKTLDLSNLGTVSGAAPPTVEQLAAMEQTRRLVDKFYETSEDKQQRMLEENPMLHWEVCCRECGQVVDKDDDD